MNRSKMNIAGAAVVALGMAAGTSAMAASVTHTLTLTQDNPNAATIFGSFGIDDALLVANAQINFVDFDFFNISVAGLNWSLSDAVLPNAEGVVTDASGVVTGFNDTVGSLTEFCMGCGTYIRFTDGATTYDTNGGTPTSTSGTYSISVATAAVPLPAALPLLGFALGGLGFAARRKRKAA